MFSTFTGKPLDIDVLCASWPNAPRFEGNFKKDPKVEDWLKDIETGCIERKVPKKYWHAVAQRYMGKRACDRLYEVKKVMMELSRGVYVWNWKKFVVAMKNMNWQIDEKRVKPFRLDMIPGLWWMVPKEKVPEAVETLPSNLNKPFLRRALRRNTDTEVPSPKPLAPPKSKSVDDTKATLKKSKPVPVRANSTPAPSPESQGGKPWTLLHMRKPEDPAQVRVVNAPEWLLTAVQALDSISTEYPKTMSVLAAVLITVGSVPNLPVAAGTAVASGTAHAIGAVAVGLGSWISAQQRGMVEVS